MPQLELECPDAARTEVPFARTRTSGRPSVATSVRGSRVYSQQLAYAPNGQRRSHRLTYGAYDRSTTLGYDEHACLTSLIDPSGRGPTTLGYNADGLNVSRYAPGLAFQTGFSGVHAPTVLDYGLPGLLNREYACEAKFGFLSDRIRGDAGFAFHAGWWSGAPPGGVVG